MAITLKRSSGAAKIDVGTYKAVVKAVAIETPKKPSPFNPDCDPFLKWTLKIHKATREGVEVEEPFETSYITTMKFTNHPKNKLNNFLKAAGVETDVDELDVEMAVGKRVEVRIEDQETEQGVFSQIVAVYAAPQVKKPAPAPAAPAPRVAAPKVAPKPVAKVAPPPVEEVEEEDAPPPDPEAVGDDLGDLDDWANLD